MPLQQLSSTVRDAIDGFPEIRWASQIPGSALIKGPHAQLPCSEPPSVVHVVINLFLIVKQRMRSSDACMDLEVSYLSPARVWDAVLRSTASYTRA